MCLEKASVYSKLSVSTQIDTSNHKTRSKYIFAMLCYRVPLPPPPPTHPAPLCHLLLSLVNTSQSQGCMSHLCFQKRTVNV